MDGIRALALLFVLRLVILDPAGMQKSSGQVKVSAAPERVKSLVPV